jgi:ribonucleoside-triphosphate reductase
MDINVRLKKNFVTQYNKLQADYGTDLARLNGFDDAQLSYVDFIDNFIDTKVVADASIDGNSNVSKKDIVTLLNEMPKPHRKLLAYNKIHYEMQKEFGFKTANEWLRADYEGKLYMHDADTSTFKHYCFAYDLKDLAEKGLYFIGAPFNPEPAKHLTTFVDFVKEFISYASNRSSGAVGLPNLLPYMWYFWHKDVESDYLGLASSGNAEKYARQNFQRFVYAVNQPYVRDGSQSAFTNTSVFDRPYYEALFGGSEFPDGSFMIDYEEEIIEFQKWYMEEVAEIRSHNMFTFPVLSISLLKQNGKFQDEEFARWAVQHNMRWSDSNLFIDDSVTSLSNCCRLKSDIKDLGYFNSIGGTALKVGSVKVSTINLARLALDSYSEFDYLVGLRKLTLLNLQALHCVRNIIRRNVEKGLLPNFTQGLVDFEHLYNTIGFIGIYETMKKFGHTRTDEFGNVYYTKEASALGQTIFKTIREVADQFIADMGVDYHINTEQIPGEQAAAKLMKKDKFFYPDAQIFDLPLYGNQFIPLGIKTTLAERVRIAAEFDSYCNGGSILHANIDAPFDSFEKAWDMVNYISDAGVTYFAFNTKIQACDNNHAFYGQTCPVCGRPVETEYTRIVGFYTPIKTWSKERTSEYKMRKWEPVNKS